MRSSTFRNCHRPFGRSRSALIARGCAFSLIELLVAIAILSILAGLLLPSLGRSKLAADRIACTSNLRQLSLAAQMYWDDNIGACFRYDLGPTNGGRLYWFGWLQNGAEGERLFDPAPGALYPYLRGHSVGLCPALSYSLAQFKLKATGAAYGYGYNLYLSSPADQSPLKILKVPRPSELVLFADAAQVNDFQPPASKTNPMLEEWYYVDLTTNYPNGHFRHQGKANVIFCDGHWGNELPVPGSLDVRLPSQRVGRLRNEILVFQ